MNIFHSDSFRVALPPGHRFPMEKYRLLRERVEDWVGTESGPESEIGASASPRSVRLHVPPAATDEDILTVHTAGYLDRLSAGALNPVEVRRMGFPWSRELVERSKRSAGGTISAARAALSEGVGVNLSGGTHHAFPDRGEGYCVLNDVAVATRVVQREQSARRILVIDLDVHQGNGTAWIFRDDREVFTLSIHGANNYPFRKVPGDLDLDLPDEAGDDPFLEAVDTGVSRAMSEGPYDLAFYLAGADPFVGDRLGRLAVTKEGLRERDARVFTACRKAGVPVAVVMGGGYASPIRDTVDIYFQTVLAAAEASPEYEGSGAGRIKRI